MTTRKRLTWSGKTASPPPADPGYEEPSVHPAAYPDPGPDDYKNGDTSSWAEDPHPGPYPNTPHPALPGTEAPMGHPATDPAHYFPGGVGKQAAAQLRAAMEVKAAKCIRIATAMLGKTATVDAIEDQALDLMNLTERQIQAALQRLGNYTLDTKKSEKEEVPEDAKADKKAADDDDGDADEDDANEDAEKLEKKEEKADEDKDEETAGKKASRLMRQAFYWMGVAKKAGEMPEALKEFQFGKKKDDDKGDDKKEDKAEDKKDDKEDKKASVGRKATSMPGTQNEMEHYEYRARGVLADELEALNEDEELLAEMLKEESKKAADKDEEKPEEKPAEKADEDKADKAAALDPEEEALLAGMLSDEDAPAVTACGEADVMDPMGDIVLDSDPMGLMDDAGADLMSDDELSALYGSKFAGDEDADKAEEKPAEKVEEKKEAKTASKAPAKPAQHPQPRRASTGVRALGGTPRVAATGRDVDDLSKLWETAPDVSKIFG